MATAKSLSITHSSLAKLEESQAWLNSGLKDLKGFSAEEIYGPKGKLNHFWSRRWVSEEMMQSDLSQNMGGGVPYEVMVALVEICVDERTGK